VSAPNRRPIAVFGSVHTKPKTVATGGAYR
jgi:hypothetical protein